MELNQFNLLEELLLAQSNGEYPWTTFHTNSITFDHQELNSNSSFLGHVSSKDSNFTVPIYEPFNHVQNLTDLEMGSMNMEDYVLDPFPNIQEKFEGMEEDVQICEFVNNCKAEGEELVAEGSKMKKVGAQPSKNLMAERRRRKRLNDRLSMLRSIVPKISKMDRTAIVGDTIDYIKELRYKIDKLQEDKDIINQKNVISGSNFNDIILSNHSFLRNNPKFDVERKKDETRIELCCNAKPRMLLSTLSTLETLGLDVQQCVISCFNDFSLQASCSEVGEQPGIMGVEDMKQVLFRNAGYGGRCL